jgi:hypothetical protein
MSMNQETRDIVKHKPIFTPKSAVLKLHKSTKICKTKKDPIRNPISSSSTKITAQTLEQLSASQTQKIPVP